MTKDEMKTEIIKELKKVALIAAIAVNLKAARLVVVRKTTLYPLVLCMLKTKKQ